jgi:very-short-patch-repair endonuclease
VGPQVRTADQKIARIARDAHGIVTHDELRRAGITTKEIRTRRKRGSLLVVFRGVYRVGHAAPSVEATYMAAVKACGKGAVLRGRPAGFHFGILRGGPPPAEVVAPTERRIKEVSVKRSRKLDPRDCTVWRGIPVTSLPRTLVDLAAVLDEQALAQAVHEASVRHGITPAQVHAVLRRNPNAKGAQKLRSVLDGTTPLLLSRLERGFRRLLKRHKLPLPQTNTRIDGRYVDCRWPRHKLTVELDGYRSHSSRHAWEADRRREREAYARGDAFRRYTWADVFEDQKAMLGELSGLLS